MSVQDGMFDLTTRVPMFHPNLLKAKPFMKNGKPQGEPKFSANFGFDPESTDLRDLRTLCAQLARAQWPGRNLAELAKPWSDGTVLADKAKAKVDAWDGQGKAPKLCEYNRGKVIITARSQFRPQLSFVAASKIVDVNKDDEAAIIAAMSKFFFGSEVLAGFKFCTYEGVGQNPDGINAYLNAVIATGHGTRIGGGVMPSERFKGYVGHVSNEDPTQTAGAEASW